MPKRSRKPKSDPNTAAFDIVKQIIDSGEANGKNPIAVALGRMGGLKGGRARADTMTKSERIESARNAAKARWGRRKSGLTE
jgi:hypothetical protein